jgi:hypothetical protein
MTGRRRPGNPYALGIDMWQLGMESAMVIGLRTLKLAAGGAAAKTETERMIAEKIAAAAELPLALAASGATSPEALTRTTLRHYSRKVRANRKRLSGPPAKS